MAGIQALGSRGVYWGVLFIHSRTSVARGQSRVLIT